MPVNFYQKQKVFLHDFTLIASVVKESVIGHGIGGKDIPEKWHNLSNTVSPRHPISQPIKLVMAPKIHLL
jgi:hypothetical protein